MAGVIRRTSISLPEDLMNTGLQIAKQRRRNFSNYIADLIALDAEKEAQLAKIGEPYQGSPDGGGSK